MLMIRERSHAELMDIARELSDRGETLVPLQFAVREVTVIIDFLTGRL